MFSGSSVTAAKTITTSTSASASASTSVACTTPAFPAGHLRRSGVEKKEGRQEGLWSEDCLPSIYISETESEDLQLPKSEKL